MKSSKFHLVALLGAFSTLIACSEPPELRLDVAPAITLPESVRLGEPVRIDYKWVPGAEFVAPEDNYRIRVQALAPDGQVVAQEEHMPAVATRQWSSDEPIEYQSWFHVPATVRVDYVDIRVALHDGQDIVAVGRQDRWQTASDVGRLRILTEDRRGMPLAVEGWSRQRGSEEGHKLWHWTRETAVASFRNPRADSVLHLYARSPIDQLHEPQRVRLTIGELQIADLTLRRRRAFVERFELPAEALGDDHFFEVRFEVSPTFDDGEEQPRIRGLQVYSLYLSFE